MFPLVDADLLNLAWTTDDLLIAATLAPLVGAMGVAAVIDWRTRRIPNALTLPLLLAGLVRAVGLWLLGIGAFTPVDAVLGMLAGFVAGVPLFAIGARGAGDAKLYIAAGAWVGGWGVLVLFVFEAIIGLIYVVGRALMLGQLPRLLANTGVLVLTLLNLRHVGLTQAQTNARHFTVYGETSPNTPQPRFTSIDRPLPHAVPLLGAMVLAICLGYL